MTKRGTQVAHPYDPNISVNRSYSDGSYLGITIFETFYAAALTGVCMNPILCAQAIENSKSNIVGQATDMNKALAHAAYNIATAAMQKLENESKEGF